jgi:AAA domain
MAPTPRPKLTGAELDRAVHEALSGPAQIGAPHLESLGAGAGYAATFRDAHAVLTANGLRQGRDGLKADVRVEVGPFANGDLRPLTEGRLELASISQRETWERRLSKRWPAADWGAVMDRFCAAVLLAEKRLDRPAILLRDAIDPPANAMAIAPLVLRNLHTLWFGADGTLKSYAALAAGLSIHAGLPLMGVQPGLDCRVALANFEPFDAGEHKSRMRKLLGVGLDFPVDELPDIVYIECYGSTLPEQVERLQRVIRDERIGFMILDSIGFAADGPLNDDETARRFWMSAGQLGRPILATGHTPKEGDQVFGSRFWRAGARGAWHITKIDGDNPSQPILRFINQKLSVDAAASAVNLAFDFSDGRGVRVRLVGAQEVDAADRLHDRVIAELRQRGGHPRTYAELSLGLGKPENAIRRTVHEHPDLFTVLEPADGGKAKRVGLRARRAHLESTE